MVDQIQTDSGREVVVDVVDEESHRSEEMVQVEAVRPDLSLSDESGEKPWLFREEVVSA